MSLRGKLLFFPALAVGILVLVLAVASRQEVPIKPAQSKSRPVDVLTLTQQDIAPQVTGFGRVMPKMIWQAIAEVNGEIIYRHPALEKGSVLPAGTELLRIDPRNYQLALAQAQADVSLKETRLDKLALDEKNLSATLALERQRLALIQDELTRKKELRDKGLTSQSDLDTQQQALLSQQTRVQDLDAQLKLLPNEKRSTEYELEASRLARARAERDLAKTELILPVDSRIAEVHIERYQVVMPQQVMVVAQGLGAYEVDAQVSMHDMQTLFNSLNADHVQSNTPKLQDLLASVSFSSGGYNAEWPATIARLSDTVNQSQATLGVMLEITLEEKQQQTVATGSSLFNEMFVKATLEGQPVAHWVIPERALRGDKIYVLEESKLKIVPVKILFRRGEQVAIKGDLKAGQQLVLNDLLPAVLGMELHAVTRDGERVANEAEAL